VRQRVLVILSPAGGGINSAKDLGPQRRALDDRFGLFEERSAGIILKKKGGITLPGGTREALA
jgi:hypothetical protein